MRELKEIRRTINEIDNEMRALFEKRMHAVREVAEYKQAHGLPIHDPAREEQVIESNALMIDDDTLRPFYVSY